MDRVIKLRGKSIRSQKWVTGGIGDNRTDIIRKGLAIPVDKKTVGQFTGFLDMYDKEIYEGDIIQNDEHPEIVEYVEMMDGCWSAVDEVDYSTLDWTLRHGLFKVIGNVHDNPELLEVQHGEV